MDRVLQNTSTTIQVTLRDKDGTAVDADAPPTYIIKDSAGTTVKSGTSTDAAGTGIYEIALLNTDTAILDLYSTTWTATISTKTSVFTTRYEIVGGFLFGVAELRDFDTNLTSAAYPTTKVVAAREAAEERLEELAGIAFRPRGKREYLNGTGDTDIFLSQPEPRRIVSAKIDGTTLTASELTDVAIYPTGRLSRKTLGVWTTGDPRNVEVFYEHGLDQPPEPVRRAAMALARSNLVGQDLWSRRTGEQTEAGFWRLTLAGRAGAPTGIPEVDAVIHQFGRRYPRIA